MIIKDLPRNWRIPPHPKKKLLEKVNPYNQETEKLEEDERASDGIIVPKKQGNSCGGKYPYY